MTATIIDPGRYDAVLFDLDGVITDTASVHAVAWRRLFDDFLARRRAVAGEDHRPFSDEDYAGQVDGKPRADGVIDFLRSRGIDVPLGTPGDEAGQETAYGLGKLKDGYFRAAVADQGVTTFDGAVTLLESLRRHGLHTAVISASRNCLLVLRRADLDRLFDVRVDGVVAETLGLAGKPDPATFLQAARALRAAPARSVVIEDSRAGVQAAKRGGFALVVGVSRAGRPEPLLCAGADVIISGLTEVVVRARSHASDPDPSPADLEQP